MYRVLQKLPVRITSLLSLIFFFSGFAALSYQVAWQRLLTVYYGVGTISITIIVSVYMFGMGLGALCGGYLAERVKNKINLYFIVELLIGCFGLISLSFLDFLGRYTAGSSYVTAFLYMFLFLSLPTLLMGITLPLLTKIFNRLTHNFITTVSFLYFINTIGAAVGAVFSSYVVISLFGLDTAIYLAAIMNFILAALIFLAKYSPEIQSEQEKVHVPVLQDDRDAGWGKFAYLLVFITGFLAIGYEIVWFRVVGVLVKASPYAFSSILSVYLAGIALGSIGMHKYLNKYKNVDKKSLFFLLQFLIGVFIIIIFIGYYYLSNYTFLGSFTHYSFSIDLHPNFKIPSLLSVKPFLKDIFSLFDVFLWPLFFVMIPTILMGASFPLISFLALKRSDREGQTVGTVYFFNITGNVLGGIATGFLLLPYLGAETTLLGFSLIGLFLGLFITRLTNNQLKISRKIGIITILLIIAITFFPKKGQLYETMHVSPGKEFKGYLEEGVDGVIMTYQNGERVKNYINGLQHAFRPGYTYYHEAIEALSLAPKVENVLIIGYGTGSITEAVLKINDVKKVTLVEINRDLIENLKKMAIFRKLLSDNRIDLIFEDGRRLLLRTDEKFDLVLIDPLRTTTSYSNNIYSAEFFELVKHHLNPGGIFMVSMEEDRVIPKTILHVFEYMQAYEYFFLASSMPIKRNHERQKKLIDSFSPQARKEIAKIYSSGIFRGNQDDIKKIVSRYPINQDWNPVCEYYLGLRIKKLFLKKTGRIN